MFLSFKGLKHQFQSNSSSFMKLKGSITEAMQPSLNLQPLYQNYN